MFLKLNISDVLQTVERLCTYKLYIKFLFGKIILLYIEINIKKE